MKNNSKPDKPESLSRRHALRRLAGAVVAAYVVPEVVLLSEARAGSSASDPASAPTAPSSGPSTSTPAPSSSSTATPSGGLSGPSNSRTPGDSCNISGPSGAVSIRISRSDMARSQEAVAEGYAQPLENIWPSFTSNYNGRVIGVEFTGRRQNTRYRFRAISRSGRLETVTISAQTGEILRIVGC